MSIYIWTEPSWSEGLLGWRPLQTDLLDASGNGYNGSWLSGTGSFSTAASKTGARVTRDSNKRSTQHVITTLNYQSSPITVCGWICFNTAPNSSSDPWNGLMTTSNASGVGYTVGTRPADNYYPQVAFGDSIRISTTVPSTNTWYFWAGTLDGMTVKTYLNGVLANTSTITIGTAGGVWKLGCAMIDSGQTLQAGTDGWVRHCAIWNKAITADQILDFYNYTK